MKKANPSYSDIFGAPFKIGQKVKVSFNEYDETFDSRFSNLFGEIIYFEYECGCGQSFPSDPMIGVKFEGEILEEFWSEELIAL